MSPDKNKKLVIATGIFPPDIGGPATYSETMARELTRRGFEVVVITYADEEESRIKNQEARGKENNEKYKIVTVSRRLSKGIRHFVYFWRVLRAAKGANVIYTPSEYLKKLVIGWGVPEDKIKVIYNAYTEQNNKFQAFVPSSGRGVSNYKFQGDVIISVGRLVPWKGFGALIEIMPELFKENPNFKLLIVGEGPQKENLKSQISNLKLNEKVILLGKVSHAELEAYLKMAKMFVLNTAYEGLSHQLLEALAAELPVVTTNVCGNPEVITDGENGILVDFNDKMALKKAVSRLWKDRVLTEKFIQNGKKTLEKFSLEKMIEGTVSVLKL